MNHQPAESLRTDALNMLRDALSAVNPEELFRSKVSCIGDCLHVCDLTFDLSQIDKIIVIGTGKGTALMAKAAEDVLGNRLTSGAITVKYGHGLPLEKIEVIEAGHPVLDEQGLKGTSRILQLLGGVTERDLVLVLITGGGSALLENPVAGVTLGDLQNTTRSLLACGAEIAEINSVRKHLSCVKGGQLLRAAASAQVVTLILSDVIGDPPEAISSGPTSPDPTTFSGCWSILEKYHLLQSLPQSVLKHLAAGLRGEIPDTPKPGDPIFDRSHLRIIGNNRLMLEAAAQSAKNRGYRTFILTNAMCSEARKLGMELAVLLKFIKIAHPSTRPRCLIAGGETTVTLRGSGKGGRNQELALAAALELDGMDGCLLLSAGSDGGDGPTDAAGALVDGTTVLRGTEKDMPAAEYLGRNDSYTYFAALGDLIKTGPTLTNVMDLVVMLVT
ncbi:MAG: glycerate kinase [bacterium]|nr:glycerate kinase [bacterium]